MFSKDLEQSIANLFDQAQDQNLEYLTIEHLLLMLINNYDVREALETNDLNIETLRENLQEHVHDNTPIKVDSKKPVQPNDIYEEADNFEIINYTENVGSGYGWILVLIGLAILSIVFYIYVI